MKKLLVIMLLLVSVSAQARDRRQALKFRRMYVCPSTQNYYGHCEGWIIDHRQALGVGGVDNPSNMYWMTTDDAAAKDRWERRRGWQQRLETCTVDSTTRIQTCER